MKRIIATLLTCALALACTGLQAGAAHAGEGTRQQTGQQNVPAPVDVVALKPNVTVNGDMVRLGDIFIGAGQYAERSVAYAPRPGGRAVFDANWLARIAAGFKLDWRPASRSDRVIVERASQIVTKGDIETILQNRWLDDGGDPSAVAKLSNRAFRLHLPVNTADSGGAALDVEQMHVDPANGRFVAVLTWGTAANERTRLTGRVVRMAEVPVLSSRLRRGEVIGEGDIEWQSMELDRLARGAITEPDEIIGMAAKRTLHPGRPVTGNDIRRPLLVNRGDTITMVLSTPMMQLTAKGRALENGSRGETIRISNLQTSTVVDAVVSGPGQARIESDVNLAMR